MCWGSLVNFAIAFCSTRWLGLELLVVDDGRVSVPSFCWISSLLQTFSRNNTKLFMSLGNYAHNWLWKCTSNLIVEFLCYTAQIYLNRPSKTPRIRACLGFFLVYFELLLIFYFSSIKLYPMHIYINMWICSCI